MTQEQIDAVILDFLKAYKAWADKDAPKNEVFCAHYGLCSNLALYADQKGASREDCSALKYAIKRKFGGNSHPFSSVMQYEEEVWKRVHHRNPARMAWVNEQIERMEK